jgi:hypothetical protein
VRSFVVCTHPQISLGRSNQVGMACGTHGRGNLSWFWFEIPKERDRSEDQGVGGRMESERILGRLVGVGVDWFRLAQDNDSELL